MEDIPPRPKPLPVNLEEIPEELRFLNQWVDWKYVWKEGKDGNPGKWDKPLFNPQGWKASVKASHTWSPFADVKAAYETGNYDGIGLVMLKKPDVPLQIVGFDFDRCRDPNTGEIDQKVRSQLDHLNSYSEISPSGTGIRVFAKGDIPADGRRTRGIEIYKHAHYLTLTGQRLTEYPSTIEASLDAISEIYNEHFWQAELKADPVGGPDKGMGTKLTDGQIIFLASEAANSKKFLALMGGDTNGYQSHSEADQALCSILAFYTTNEGQIDSIFRRSGLYREKWERADYRESTIGKAISFTAKHYNGSEPNAEEQPEDEKCDPCDVYELIATFKKWLYLKEDYNITAPFTEIVANFCDGSPDIVGIIGPSGSTKTEIIRSLGETQNKYVYPISTITEHTLVSGHKDSRDLVPQLKGRILAIKDLTSILSRKEDVRAAIFADFRELTDGYIRKEFGNGIAKEYQDIHSSILFASTNAIERYYSMYSNLGQRMIFIRPNNDPKEARKRASENRGKQKEMRAELHAVTKRFIASMLQAKSETGLPTTPDDILEEMGILYDFLAIARTSIHHDFKTGEMDELPEPEFPTRIANTIGRLCEVHALFYGRDEVNAEDMAFGCRIVSDNIPSMRWKVLRSLTKEWQHTAKISQVADLPSRAAKYHLDELVALKLAEKLLKDEAYSSMDRRSDYFKLSDLASDAIEIYDTRIRIEGIIQEEQSKLIDKLNILLPNPCVVLSGGNGTGEQEKEGGDDRSEVTIGPNPRKDESSLIKLKKGMAKRRCCLCGRIFPYDLTPYFNNGQRGHICSTCHMQGPPSQPAKTDPQTKLDGEARA